jgi:peptidoglycan-N-acetylglucosamine deacetylase
MRWASVSVDLDSLPHYLRIHGLSPSLLGKDGQTLIFDVAVPRLLSLFERAQVPASLFVVGEDLQHRAAGDALRRAHAAGVELGNHSYRHDYAMTRLPKSAIKDEVWRGHQAIERLTGRPPVGFRAPGYTLSAELYGSLEELGYRYDSSVFPATPYYAAKAVVMAALAVTGKASKAFLDTPRVLLSPATAYRPDPAQPYRQGAGSVVELPIAVSPGLRLPFIGTFAAALPPALVRATYQTLRRVPHFNFELHAIDVLDAEDGIPSALVKRQRDLRVPHDLKLRRLGQVLEWMKEDFTFATLADVASRLQTELLVPGGTG